MSVKSSHPIFDPRWADDILRRSFGSQFLLAEEMIRFGADLMLRALQTAPKTKANQALITILFRQSLAAADAGFVALHRGVVDAASVHVRRMLEMRWAMQLAFGDPEKWGNHLHISSIRENRFMASRFVPGTEEYVRFNQARDLTSAALPLTEEMIEAYKQAIAAADEILVRPAFAAINAGFAVGRKDLGYEPPWYYDGTLPRRSRIKSIRGLAVEVGAVAEYDTIYKYTSYSVHGTHESTHRKYDDHGSAIAPLRTPEGFRHEFVALTSMLIRSIQTIMEHFRPAEIEQFAATHVAIWKQTIRDTPQLKFEAEPDL